jgi:phosphate transport system permease protein
MASYTVRKFKDRLAFGLAALCVLIAVIPLGSILFEVVRNGAPAISIEFLTQTPGPIGQPGGGIANAIEGTLILIGLTCLIGVPLGVMSGIYLSEYGDNKFGRTVRFFNDVLAEFPSIVVGIFVYVLVVLMLGSFSVIAGAIALAIIMLPVVSRTTEESLKLVPNSIREAAMALGVRRWRTIVSVVLSTGKGGIVTGIMLSVARIAGMGSSVNSHPVSLGSEHWSTCSN